ncbi:4Fe-4S ferredoxin N-terminal domain-containing protein [Halovenus sp. HT40]|uniref:4Fe-4S ferredoxin N-terminal domain-containing protein n=1 Tax=Halovenus sp. HT40 TaxID=3126691 RepID=UPI00300EB7AC
MSTEEPNDTEDGKHPYETENSFHPMGEQWEDQMREELEDTDYDADLGMEMARDAQRLVAGELTEEEFYAEYHDDVKEEFETDERPIFDDLDGVDLDEFEDESLLESLADVDLSADDVSRRDMMNKMGAAGLFLGYSAFATYDDGQDEEVPQLVDGVRPADKDEREHRWGMTIDLERCDGCLACVAGCINENGTSTGANWMYVFTYEDEHSESENPNQLVRPCQHCSNAPCAKVCPVRARHTRSKDGLVLTNYEVCIGCRYCQVACPYGVNYFQWGDPDVEMDQLNHVDMTPDEVRDLDPGEGNSYGGATYAEEGSERLNALQDANDHVYDARGWWVDSRPPIGTMGKCTMCPSRQDNTTSDTAESEKGSVACQDACDAQGMSAIHFGDFDAEVGDDYDRAVRYLEERQTKADTEDRTSKFDANVFFSADAEADSETEKAASAPDLSSVSPGYYSLHLVQRDGAGSEWGVYDTAEVLVAGSQMSESSDFTGSSIGSFGSVPSSELQVLNTEGEEIPASLVYSGELGDGETLDVTASLQLGGTELTSQQVTIQEAGTSTDLTFTVPASAVPNTEGANLLYLVVEANGESGAAAQEAVYVTSGEPNVETPGAPYDSVVGQDGELLDVPAIAYQSEPPGIEAEISYPSSEPATKQVGLVLYDGDTETVVAQTTFEFKQPYTSNTAWDSGLSTFKLLEDLGTSPNITYIGNEPGPKAEQVNAEDMPVTYASLDSSVDWDVNVIDKRLERLKYGASPPSEKKIEQGGGH